MTFIIKRFSKMCSKDDLDKEIQEYLMTKGIEGQPIPNNMIIQLQFIDEYNAVLVYWDLK